MSPQQYIEMVRETAHQLSPMKRRVILRRYAFKAEAARYQEGSDLRPVLDDDGQVKMRRPDRSLEPGRHYLKDFGGGVMFVLRRHHVSDLSGDDQFLVPIMDESFAAIDHFAYVNLTLQRKGFSVKFVSCGERVRLAKFGSYGDASGGWIVVVGGVQTAGTDIQQPGGNGVWRTTTPLTLEPKTVIYLFDSGGKPGSGRTESYIVCDGRP